MRTATALLAVLAVTALPPGAAARKPPKEAPAPAKIDEAAQQRKLDTAQAAIHAGRSADALAPVEEVIAAYDAAYKDEKRTVYGARSPAEVIYYMTQAASTRTDAVAIGDQWGAALYLKGYVLIDLGRADEAATWFERAIRLSPVNAQYLGEYAEWYKARHDWSQAYALFERALAAAEFSPDAGKDYERRRALRGMGFARIEQGRLDDAEALFNKALAIDPNDAGARRELDYIRQQRAKAAIPKT